MLQHMPGFDQMGHICDRPLLYACIQQTPNVKTHLIMLYKEKNKETTIPKIPATVIISQSIIIPLSNSLLKPTLTRTHTRTQTHNQK